MGITTQQRRTERAQFLLNSIDKLNKSIGTNYWTLGQHLSEIKHDKFYQMWGHTSFYEWLSSSRYGISPSQARYLTSMVEKSHKLDLKREQVENIGITKNRYIFSMDATKHRETILDLVARGKDMSIDDIKNAVGLVYNRPPRKTISLTFTKPQIATLQRAITKARGDEDGLSEQDALVKICNNYIGA